MLKVPIYIEAGLNSMFPGADKLRIKSCVKI